MRPETDDATEARARLERKRAEERAWAECHAPPEPCPPAPPGNDPLFAERKVRALLGYERELARRGVTRRNDAGVETAEWLRAEVAALHTSGLNQTEVAALREVLVPYYWLTDPGVLHEGPSTPHLRCELERAHGKGTLAVVDQYAREFHAVYSREREREVWDDVQRARAPRQPR
jgi:hypothetical protein